MPTAGDPDADEPDRRPTRTVGFESGRVRCEGDLYAPGGEGPWPAVVLANVFGAPRAWGLDRFARRFAAAGLASFTFDYRGFGTSEGTPRRLVDPDRQLADWRAALGRVRSLPEVDPTRIATWGTSFSGGHVLRIAREAPDVSAVVAMVPFVDGRAVMAHQTAHLGPLEQARFLAAALADRLLGAVGLGPIERPTVSDPNAGGLVDTPGAAAGFLSLVPEGAPVENRMPARVLLELPRYRPGLGAEAIDVPVHVVIAEADGLLPVETQERLVESLGDASVHRVDGAGHFDPHVDPWFDEVAERQVVFLTEALGAEP